MLNYKNNKQQARNTSTTDPPPSELTAILSTYLLGRTRTKYYMLIPYMSSLEGLSFISRRVVLSSRPYIPPVTGHGSLLDICLLWMH